MQRHASGAPERRGWVESIEGTDRPMTTVAGMPGHPPRRAVSPLLLHAGADIDQCLQMRQRPTAAPLTSPNGLNVKRHLHVPACYLTTAFCSYVEKSRMLSTNYSGTRPPSPMVDMPARHLLMYFCIFSLVFFCCIIVFVWLFDF